MTLFEECLVAIGKEAKVLSEKETSKVFDSFTTMFPITTWGRIDWEKVKHRKRITVINCLDGHIYSSKDDVYILWDEASLPAIKLTLDSVLSVINEITAVSFDTWIYCPINRYVIEFYHDGEINIGWFD